MEVVLGSQLLRSEVFPTIDVRGQEHLVVVTKGCWTLPGPGQRPKPIPATQLVYTDDHYGEPGFSALRYAADMAARFKPQCDILFDACAHSPDGQPVPYLGVQAQVGHWKKQIKVWGQRTWKKTLLGFEPSKPKPFVSMPLHTGLAFGASRPYVKNIDGKQVSLTEAFDANPIGVGWAGPQTIGQMDDQPMPCLEDIKDPIQKPDGRHHPIGFNAISANVPERSQYAGTYDEVWRRDVFPFLPEDFDERFFQCAPFDQRVNYPQGGEEVQLINICKGQSHVKFKLPPLNDLQVRVLRKDYSVDTPEVHADTLFFETEAGRFSVVWRASVPIYKHLDEMDTIAVGPVDPEWWEAKSLGLLANKGCKGCDS
jgi:hypothetical protein